MTEKMQAAVVELGEGVTNVSGSEPIDVAYRVLYLASDESKFVTGRELVIDGGYTAR